MAQIKYVVGDVLQPKRLSNDNWCIIAQVVNNVGAFGAGLAAQTTKQFPEVKRQYRTWCGSSTFKLGAVELVILDRHLAFEQGRKLVFALMCAQDGLPDSTNTEPLKYPALQKCLQQLGHMAKELQAEVHMPRIGCGIARGKWGLVHPFIITCIPNDVPVFVYDRREPGLRTFQSEMLGEPWPDNPNTRTHIHPSVYEKVKFV